MDIVVDKACGLDVHKKTVVACIMGSGIMKKTRTYRTFTRDLEELKAWLKENGITHVVMESTGVYWKPVFNLLEDSFEIMLVNARHIKNVPGRKTDVQDSEWLCKLLRSGLLRGSFIPPKDIRELRDLTRYRRKLVQTKTAEKNRIQKVLETANIKLSSVLSDNFGVSGTDIMEELLKGKLTVDEMAELARGRLKKKKDDLKEALYGNLDEHHRFMLKASLEHIEHLDRQLKELDKRISKRIEKYRQEYELLQTIPGIKEHGASSIIAEIGVDMDRFPTEDHLSSWAGMSPGNNESAGKKKAQRTTHGDKSLKATLTEGAWAAAKTKKTYLRAKYYSLVGRRGKKKALIAVGHKILIASYYILRHKVCYDELGFDYLNKRKSNRIARNYIKKLKELGYEVNIAPTAA